MYSGDVSGVPGHDFPGDDVTGVLRGDVRGIPGHDFMAIELIGGRVQYSFDLGGGSRVLPDNGHRLVSDGQWHTVYVSRPTVDRHMLMVITYSCIFHYLSAFWAVSPAFSAQMRSVNHFNHREL